MSEPSSSSTSQRWFTGWRAASPLAIALLFTLGLLALEASVFDAGYRELLELRLTSGNAPALLALVAFVVSTAVFLLAIWASLRAHRGIRLAYFAVFALAAMIEYAYQYGFGRFSEVTDYEVGIFAINSHHLTSAVTSYANVLVLLPMALYGILLIRASPRSGATAFANDFLVFLALLAALVGVLTTAARFETFRYPALSVVASFRTLVSVPWLVRLDPGPRPEITYRASAAPQNNIIFVVAESVRGDHLSINGYERPTTPFLEELVARGTLTNWGLAAAATTCSLASNLALLTGTPVEESQRAPTIFQYAKAMGYRTFYVDGQMTKAWNGTPRDRSTWDVWLTANEFDQDGTALTDSRIGARVAEIVNSSVGNFIWINKFGVHTAYDLDYPPSEAVWTPIYGGRGVALAPLIAPLDLSRRQAFINSFDNAVRWSVESFFRGLFAGGVPAHTTLLYTADHGQTLGEQGERHSHCGSSRTEAIVPLFAVSSWPEVLQADTAFKASHSNSFATLLDLMGFPEGERQRTYDVSLLKATSAANKPRTYMAAHGRLPFD